MELSVDLRGHRCSKHSQRERTELIPNRKSELLCYAEKDLSQNDSGQPQQHKHKEKLDRNSLDVGVKKYES
jgi:hypothetical protein